MCSLKIILAFVFTVFLFSSLPAAPGDEAEAERQPHYLAMVLGPARSGTSAITRAVHACGYALTPKVLEQQEKLDQAGVQAQPRLNPRGSFEDNAFLQIGRQFLNRTQDNETPLAFSHPLAQKGRQNIGKFFNAIFKDGITHVVLKHPALSKHAAILEQRAQQEDVSAQHLNIQFLYIIALRHPVDTALSMYDAYHEKTPELTLENTLQNWQENLTNALATTEGKRRFFVKYDDVMDNTDQTLARLAVFLGTPLTDIALATFKSEFLTEDLRHGRTPFAGTNPDHTLTREQLALRDHLEALYQAQ